MNPIVRIRLRFIFLIDISNEIANWSSGESGIVERITKSSFEVGVSFECGLMTDFGSFMRWR